MATAYSALVKGSAWHRFAAHPLLVCPEASPGAFLQVVFLNQIILSKKGDGSALAKSLIGLYFGLFKVSASLALCKSCRLIMNSHSREWSLLLGAGMQVLKLLSLCYGVPFCP